jgi:REP element-mobilizing transposase RayT
MARALRLDPADGIHHVMNRGVNRMPIFVDDNDRTSFGQRLTDAHERFDIVIHAYCLMDNHFHLLVRCPNAGLSAAMQRLSSVFTRHTNDRHGRDGPLFRGRFHSRLITDEGHLLNAVRYIHRNPLDLPAVGNVLDYRWSSHRTYLGLRRCPPWLDTGFVLDLFGGGTTAFARFVDEPPTPDPIALTPRVDIGTLREAVRLMLMEVTSLADNELAGAERAVTLLAAERLGWIDQQATAAALGIPSPGAYRTARSRARTAAARSEELCTAVQRAVLLMS